MALDVPLPRERLRRGATPVKRIFDIVASACGLLISLPLFVLIAALIKIDSPGPVFFRQERVGRHGRPFRILKFRSMVVGAPKAGPSLTVRADSRITRVGAFLRRSKLDELPQLLNVLRGEMSIVGPRPEVPEFMEFYTPEQRAIILAMRPGMTDYASICFHDESSMLDSDGDPVQFYRQEIMPRKFLLYERYSREMSVLNDLRIIAATLSLLITGRAPDLVGSASREGLTPAAAARSFSLRREKPSRLAHGVDVDPVPKAKRVGSGL